MAARMAIAAGNLFVEGSRGQPGALKAAEAADARCAVHHHSALEAKPVRGPQ